MAEAVTDIAQAEERRVAYRDLLTKVEERILAVGGQVQKRGEVLSFAPVVHHFAPGLYCREIHMPAGLLLTSRVHKTEHPYVVSKGRCAVLTENGWTEIRAPHFGITKPGTKRFLVIFEDTVWTTFHVTDLTDISEIDKTILEDDPRVQT